MCLLEHDGKPAGVVAGIFRHRLGILYRLAGASRIFGYASGYQSSSVVKVKKARLTVGFTGIGVFNIVGFAISPGIAIFDIHFVFRAGTPPRARLRFLPADRLVVALPLAVAIDRVSPPGITSGLRKKNTSPASRSNTGGRMWVSSRGARRLTSSSHSSGGIVLTIKAKRIFAGV